MIINSIIKNSKVNGPGKRFVIWTQGCSLNCPNCWNPNTHDLKGGQNIDYKDLFKMILDEPNIEGVTFSGGEPFEQVSELLKLTKLIKIKTNLSQIVYSGYTINQIKINIAKGNKILSNIDVLIDGRFQSTNLSKNNLIGSSNQKHYFLSKRYNIKDFKNQNRLEYHFKKDGSTVLTGFPIVN